jgi:hypothetical protein
MACVVTIGAFRAHGDVAFNRWVGWATIAAVLLAVILGWPALWDRIAGAADDPPGTRTAEPELAARVLAEARTARSRLIGTDIPGDDAANVTFIRSGRGFREVGGAEHGDLGSVLEYYQSLSPRRLVVLGEPGCGKTVFVLELQVRLLEARDQDPGNPVAILVSAAAFDTGQPWDDWLTSHLAQRYAMSTETTRRLIRDRRILPLVDGLDEMDDPSGPPARALALVGALNAEMRGHERTPVIVTSRSGEYQGLQQKLDRAAQVEMLPLTAEEAAGYLRRQFRTEEEQDRWSGVLNCLEADADGLLAAQLGTPWRLTLALAAFRDQGDPSSLLPSPGPPDDQYARAVDALLLGGYVPAAVRLHAARGYSDHEVRSWLSVLADGLAWQGRHGRSGIDIRLDEWWVADGHAAIRISHVLVAALPALPWLIVSAVTGITWCLLPAAAVLLLALTTAGGTSSAKRGGFKNAMTGRGVRALLHHVRIGYLQWVVPWVTIGVLFWLVTGLRGGFRSLILEVVAISGAAALLVGVPAGVNRGLMEAFAESAPRAVAPREIIRADTRFRIAVAVTAGILIGLPVGLFFGLAGARTVPGIALGAGAGLTAGLTAALAGAPNWDSSLPFSPQARPADVTSGGASAWTRYYLSVLVTRLRGHGPWRFAEFLEWGQRAGLLRVVGVAYQFRHRQLQDLLTTSPSPPS